MVIRGYVRNGVVVPDETVLLPEGAEVHMEVVGQPSEKTAAAAVKRREGGWWKGRVSIVKDSDELPDDLAEAFG